MFDTHRDALKRFLAARGAPPQDAEDILQEVFLKLGKVPTGPIADPMAYLYRMADNLLIDARRSKNRRMAREQAWTEAWHGAGEVDHRPTIEDQLIAREQLGIVRRALALMPDRTQFIFRRFRLEEIGQRQIASELGITVSAVEKHLQRAYRSLLDAKLKLDADYASPRRLNSEGD